MKKSINLDIQPKWSEIERIRNQCSKFFESHGFSSDAVYMLIMVISELVENSIKYGYFKSRFNNKVSVHIRISLKEITIEVVNLVHESGYHNLKRLDRTIQWIRGYQDPFEAYVEKLKEVAKRPFSDEESGLGLVRIAYEGKAILDFFVGEDNTVNVSAISNLEGDYLR